MIEWWDSIVFGERWALWLLPVVPVLGVLMFLLGGKGKPVLRLSSFRYLQGVPVPGKVKWRYVLYALRLIAVILLITAFARPQSRKVVKRKHGEGIDVMLCLDVSQSMETADFIPDRIGAAKQQARKFVEGRPNDRIGLVVFSGETFTKCPLTLDHQALDLILSDVQAGELEGGTFIGMGLAKAVERIKDSKAKSKVVVLLTDGENTGGIITPVDAARLAKTYNVRVYTIGLGATEGKYLTTTSTNPDGSSVQAYLPVSIDESTLMDIAKMTGGKYFRAGDERKLETVYDEISKLEKTTFEKNSPEERKEEFLPFLLIAILLLMAEFSLRYTAFDSLT